MNDQRSYTSSRGISLLEILIVVAIISILGAAGAASYRTFGKDAQLESAKKVLIEDLKSMQSKAMTGEGGLRYGVHVVNTSTANYYELFSTPTTYADAAMAQIATTTLPRGIAFGDPALNTSKDIVFAGIGGTTTATSLSVIAEDRTDTITVTSIGTIY